MPSRTRPARPDACSDAGSDAGTSPLGKVLVTGGQRSGKSRYAEDLLADAPQATFLAPGPPPDPRADAEWAARIAVHQHRRPGSWITVEHAGAEALRAASPPVLLDSLGTWLTTLIDDLALWDEPLPSWRPRFDDALAELVAAWRDLDGRAVAVTSEVGWGLTSEHRSGRVFTDLLGEVNQQMAAVSDEVVLMVAGRPLRL